MRGTECRARPVPSLALSNRAPVVQVSLPSARAVRRARGGLVAAGAAMLAFGVAAPTASAADDPNTVHLTSVFAAPIKAAPTGDATKDDRYLCTPEASGKTIYGTNGIFDPTQPLDVAGTPPNWPSRATQQTDFAAGVSNDLCFGFTLTPNVEPQLFAKGLREQNSPAVADVADTHVFDASNQMIDGDDMNIVKVDMPAGFLGDPDSNPQCSDEQFQTGTSWSCELTQREHAGGNKLRAPHALTSGTTPSGLFVHLASGGGPNGRTDDPGLWWPRVQPHPWPERTCPPRRDRQAGAPDRQTKVHHPLTATPDGGCRPSSIMRRARSTEYGHRPGHGPAEADRGAPHDVRRVARRARLGQGCRPPGRRSADAGSLQKDFAQWGTDCTSDLSAHVSIDTYGVTGGHGPVPQRDELAVVQAHRLRRAAVPADGHRRHDGEASAVPTAFRERRPGADAVPARSRRS